MGQSALMAFSRTCLLYHHGVAHCFRHPCTCVFPKRVNSIDTIIGSSRADRFLTAAGQYAASYCGLSKLFDEQTDMSRYERDSLLLGQGLRGYGFDAWFASVRRGMVLIPNRLSRRTEYRLRFPFATSWRF
jgi:hypothetical protein